MWSVDRTRPRTASKYFVWFLIQFSKNHYSFNNDNNCRDLSSPIWVWIYLCNVVPLLCLPHYLPWSMDFKVNIDNYHNYIKIETRFNIGSLKIIRLHFGFFKIIDIMCNCLTILSIIPFNNIYRCQNPLIFLANFPHINNGFFLALL